MSFENCGSNFVDIIHDSIVIYKTTDMMQHEKIEIEQVVIQQIKKKSMERDCPRCDAVLVHNNNELCYECLNCGYIDCGEENEN